MDTSTDFGTHNNLRRNTYDERRIDVPSDGTVEKRLIGTVFGVQVYEVDGHAVRSFIDIDFLFGGNPGRYAYIPLNEVWVDGGIQKDDLAGTIVHELVEHFLMLRGLTYVDAHKIANDYEYLVREYAPMDDARTLELAQHIISTGQPKIRSYWL